MKLCDSLVAFGGSAKPADIEALPRRFVSSDSANNAFTICSEQLLQSLTFTLKNCNPESAVVLVFFLL